MKRALLYIIALALFSCNEKKVEIDLPPILDNMILSEYDDLPMDLNLNDYEFPDKIKKIHQVQNQDTLTILEFDANKNPIFKYYKQYQGEYWHDKFVFMIEATIYCGNKPIKKYSLHSNVGYEVFLYDYIDDNIKKITSYKLDNIQGVNQNQYSLIKNIKDYKTCIAFIENLNIEGKGYSNYSITRNSKDNQIKEFFNNKNIQQDDSYKLYHLINNKIAKTEYYAKGKKTDTDTKYFIYDDLCNLKKTYTLRSKRDTLKSTEYRYHNCNTMVIQKENEVEISRKEFVKNNLVKHKSQTVDNEYASSEKYILDKYGIPIKIIETYQNKDSILVFKNYYEFYN
jgi:hypothetical protein